MKMKKEPFKIVVKEGPPLDPAELEKLYDSLALLLVEAWERDNADKAGGKQHSPRDEAEHDCTA